MTNDEYQTIKEAARKVSETFWQIDTIKRSVDTLTQMQPALADREKLNFIKVEIQSRNGYTQQFYLQSADFLFPKFAKEFFKMITATKEDAEKKWKEL